MIDKIDEIFNFMKENPNFGRRRLSKKFGISERQIKKIMSQFKRENMESNENVDYIIDLERKNKKLQDKNKFYSKIKKEYTKINFLEDLIEELKNCVKDRSKINIPVHYDTNDYYGIVHLSDAHLNELVNLPHNKYDYKIASQKLQKLVFEAKRNFKSYGIKSVLLFMTGDMFSAQKHIDQISNLATSRGQAVFVAASILEQMILDLTQDFNVSVGCVVGNESRETSYQIIPSSTMLLSDNLDMTLFSVLKLMFKNTNVKFLDTNVIDCIVNIKGKNFLFIHGNTINHGNIHKSIQELKGKYLTKNIKIDYVCMGHIHTPNLSGSYFRCGSLVGDNSYSYNILNYCESASQNIYIVSEEGVNGMVINLDRYEKFDGYYVDNEMIENQKIEKVNKTEINIL